MGSSAWMGIHLHLNGHSSVKLLGALINLATCACFYVSKPLLHLPTGNNPSWGRYLFFIKIWHLSLACAWLLCATHLCQSWCFFKPPFWLWLPLLSFCSSRLSAHCTYHPNSKFEDLVACFLASIFCLFFRDSMPTSSSSSGFLVGQPTKQVDWAPGNWLRSVSWSMGLSFFGCLQ